LLVLVLVLVLSEAVLVFERIVGSAGHRFEYECESRNPSW
jgi:hypothetical protein